MKIHLLIVSFIYLASFQASAQTSEGKTAQKLLADVVGTWKLGTHGNAGKTSNVQLKHAGETLEFTREAKFISRNGSQKLDSGFYRMNENQKKLYLESAETHNPVEWNILLKNNTLTLYKNGDEANKDAQFIYLREASKTGK